MASNFSVQEDNIFKLSWSLSELSLYDENTTNDFYINGSPNSEWMIKEIGTERSMTWVQCQLGFVGDLCSYQKTPFEKFCD